MGFELVTHDQKSEIKTVGHRDAFLLIRASKTIILISAQKHVDVFIRIYQGEREKYENIIFDVQLKYNLPRAWMMYTTGSNKILKDCFGNKGRKQEHWSHGFIETTHMTAIQPTGSPTPHAAPPHDCLSPHAKHCVVKTKS